MTKRKYGKPKKRNLDQKKVKEFLVDLGFEIELIAQEWRHLHAFGKFKGKDAVFKLASTQATSSRTQNEYHWNEAVHLIPENKHPNFTVPENYSSGFFDKLFYFIAERFLGEPFLKRNSNDMNRVIPKIPQIAKATYELENLPIPSDCEFAKTKKSSRQKKDPVGHGLLRSATEWANQVPRDLDSLLEVIEKFKDSLRTSVGHGDFVIRQMYYVKGRVGIIDGELAGFKGPLYYDVAQFYIRLRNDHDAKDIAQKYLMEFKNLLSLSDKQSFWEELKPVLIQRYIGDLWGAAKKPKKLDELAPLGKEILENRII
jgi:hypothetical protein